MLHAHTCTNCGRRWVHDDSKVNDASAHRCVCGALQWWKTNMTKSEQLILQIRSIKPMDVVNHPFVFAAGVGVANGILAKARGKQVDVPTAIALALILGGGEAVIEHFDKSKPDSEKHSPLMMILLSVAGVAVGLLPFMTWEQSGGARVLPIAERETKPTEQEAVAA